MKIYKISQSENEGYDTYSDAIVVANSEEEAKCQCVCGYHKYHDGELFFQYSDGREEPEESCSGWTEPKNVSVEYIGEAKEEIKEGVVCASFHAG